MVNGEVTGTFITLCDDDELFTLISSFKPVWVYQHDFIVTFLADFRCFCFVLSVDIHYHRAGIGS